MDDWGGLLQTPERGRTVTSFYEPVFTSQNYKEEDKVSLNVMLSQKA